MDQSSLEGPWTSQPFRDVLRHNIIGQWLSSSISHILVTRLVCKTWYNTTGFDHIAAVLVATKRIDEFLPFLHKAQAASFHDCVDKDVSKIADYLSNHQPRITELRLYTENLKLSAARKLSDAVRRLSALQSLDISVGISLKLSFDDYDSTEEEKADDLATEVISVLPDHAALESIRLRRVGFFDVGAINLSQVLAFNTTLKSVTLDSCSISDSGAAALASVLAKNRHLTDLNLKFNNIGPEGAAHMAEMLKSNSTLTKLDLTFNDLRASGQLALLQALSLNQSLTDWTTCVSNEDMSSALAQVLSQNSSLARLDASNSTFGLESQLIFDSLKGNRNIKSLKLRQNNLISSTAFMIADMLRVNQALEDLDLDVNSNISNEGCAAICEALQTNQTLTSLRVSDAPGLFSFANLVKNNQYLHTLAISIEGATPTWAQTMADSLRSNSSLRSLTLYGFCRTPIHDFFNAFESNTTLRDLTMHTCLFGDSETLAMEKLASCLESNLCGLWNIALPSCSLESSSIEAIFESLRRNTTLVSLDLRSNAIGDKSIVKLASALESNITLTSLDVTSNRVGAVGTQALAESLATNLTLTRLKLMLPRELASSLEKMKHKPIRREITISLSKSPTAKYAGAIGTIDSTDSDYS